jgi:hypothetical protein
MQLMAIHTKQKKHMKSIKHLFIGAVLVCFTASFVAPAMGATIIPVSASTDMGNFFGTDLINTINGVGLAAFPSLTADHAATSPNNSWVGISESGQVTFNLGGLFSVGGFSIWNQNDGGPPGGTGGVAGINRVDVLSSTDGTNFSLITGAPTNFARVDSGDNSPPEMFTFSGVSATHIRLAIASNHGFPDSGSGFAEIAFVEAVPESGSTLAMLGLVTAGLVGVRRRRA